MKTNELFFHGETTDGRKFTLCGLTNSEQLTISGALCSSNDNFNKKIGRAIAQGRINKGKNFVTINVFKSPLEDFLIWGNELNKRTSEFFNKTFNFKTYRHHERIAHV